MCARTGSWGITCLIIVIGPRTWILNIYGLSLKAFCCSVIQGQKGLRKWSELRTSLHVNGRGLFYLETYLLTLSAAVCPPWRVTGCKHKAHNHCPYLARLQVTPTVQIWQLPTVLWEVHSGLKLPLPAVCSKYTECWYPGGRGFFWQSPPLLYCTTVHMASCEQ